MKKFHKYLTFCLLIMFASMLLLAAVNAQDEEPPYVPPSPNYPPPPPETAEQAIVVIVDALGGTTDPQPGTYTYDFADTINIEAMPNSGYRFSRWLISGEYTPGHNIPPIVYPNNIAIDDPDYVPDFPAPSSDATDNLVTSTNPLAVICGYGYTYVYQPVFVPTTEAPSTNNAIIVIVDSVGGSTTPGPGTYYYAEDTTITLQATPDAGYEFDSWVAVSEEGHPSQFTDNPTGIICGYGYTFEYQAMFAPTGNATSTDEGVPSEYLYAIIVVLAIIAVIGIGAALMYRGKNK